MRQSPIFLSFLLGIILSTSALSGAHAQGATPGVTDATPGVQGATDAPTDLDPMEACIEQHRTAQVLQQEGRLVEARAKLLACTMQQCPSLLRRDCDALLKKAESELPSVVIAAVGADGAELNALRVSVDGVVLAEGLRGQALSVDPGQRSFLFTLPDGAEQTVDAVIRTGEKFRQISVSFHDLTSDSGPATSGPLFEVPTAAWILGGAGVVSLGAAAALYFPAQGPAQCLLEHAATSESPNYGDDPAQQRLDCEGKDWNWVQDRYLYTNIAVIGGAALLAGAAAATIWVNVGDDDSSLSPQIGVNGSKVVVRGSF
jgi:hypothetical protein